MTRTYIVVLNWNGWRDTIECLESLYRLDYADVRIVVCDNDSQDGSIEWILGWARGEVETQCSNAELQRLSSPACAKPIGCLELTREQAESGDKDRGAGLVVIQTGGNLGFAGGNNVGVRYALGDPECAYVWLLNNDTVVEADALSAMVRHLQTQPETGLCGSLNLAYANPRLVQARGGKTYSFWTGRVQTPLVRMVNELEDGPGSMDFVNGASMLVRREFLEKVGLMDESYFLYFEELDWAMRGKGKFALGYACDSVIYHKEGASLGSSPDRMKRSLLSERYLSRNRVLFTKRFVPWALPTVIATVVAAAGYRLIRGDFERARAMLESMLLGLRNRAIRLESSCGGE